MLNNFFEAIIFLKYPVFCLLISLACLSLFWEKIFYTFNFKKYKSVQRVHKNEVSRLGGFFIFIYLATLAWFKIFNYQIIFNILISSIPFVLISLKEDVFFNTSPRIRLISMLISCLIFFYLNPIDLPVINLPFIGSLIFLNPVGIVFYTFSLLVIMNGMNLIDGMNGLFGFTALFQLLSICFLSFIFDDIFLFKLTIIFIMPLVCFLLFNFPLGRVFAGDLGAYLYGFIIGLITIFLFGRHEQMYSWLAVMILFYPCMELLFSFARKIRNKINPMKPDAMHLHSLIQKKVKKKYNRILISNSFTTIIISPFWIIPFLSTIYFHDNLFMILITIASLCFFYILAYKIFQN